MPSMPVRKTDFIVRRAAVSLALLLAAAPLGAQEAPGYGAAQGAYDTDGQSVDSIAVFFEPLARYGRWLDTRYGRAWSPNVGRDWRPYTIGHWEQGRFGLTWRSDEPFGWAVFHFGRWAFDPAIGWVWLPDTEWGPGWVAWRDGDDVSGWAPLPPAAGVYGSYAVTDWGYDQWYQPGWVYVPRAYLYSRSLRGAYLPYARNRELWERSRGVDRDNSRDTAPRQFPRQPRSASRQPRSPPRRRRRARGPGLRRPHRLARRRGSGPAVRRPGRLRAGAGARLRPPPAGRAAARGAVASDAAGARVRPPAGHRARHAPAARGDAFYGAARGDASSVPHAAMPHGTAPGDALYGAVAPAADADARTPSGPAAACERARSPALTSG